MVYMRIRNGTSRARALATAEARSPPAPSRAASPVRAVMSCPPQIRPRLRGPVSASMTGGTPGASGEPRPRQCFAGSSPILAITGAAAGDAM